MADPNDESTQADATDEVAAQESTATQSDGDAVSNDSAKDGNDVQTADIEKLLDQATESLEKATGETASGEAAPAPFDLNDLSPTVETSERQPIDLLGEVEMDLRIELGRTQMCLDEVLQLRGGSVVALDKLAGDPVDVFVNGRLIARGEVLVMNDNFCIRVTELVGA
ncbi:MAG: flagellar motor switch protein FliN [Rubripirellula sp.]